MKKNLVVGLVPITNKQSEVTRRVRVRNRNSRPGVDIESSKTTSSAVQTSRWEVSVRTDLIFRLKDVCEVLVWRDWAVSP